ncbi:hypothetical protein KUTeg_012792 [Tegillarca granosa]|uniref:DDE-1 domain-containing protein n=1 Tax=Tegillarca granosa TaxID=220873 RepID=A0ABQ9F0L0_TEGGR|nr:hypothetical protein KUTeg_012792 [Tegillarca granosa]
MRQKQGGCLPPYFVFKGQGMRQELLDGCSEGTGGTVSESGWSNSDIFQHYLDIHFPTYIQKRDENQPILLLYDGHRSHLSIGLINWAKSHNIILFVLPAHTSHVLQPLDLGRFGPFQKKYNSECHKSIRQNPSSTTYNICSLACRSYIHALSPANLQSSFRKSGIYPYNPSAVDEINFKPSVAFKSSCQR